MMNKRGPGGLFLSFLSSSLFAAQQTSWIFFSSQLISGAQASLIVNEVAYKGSAGQCDGSDWVELLNTGSTDLNALNYIIHDDKGIDDEDAKKFTEDMIIQAGAFKVLCKGVDFEFGIGGDDAVTLIDDSGAIVSEVVMPGTGGNDQTYAYFEDTDEWKYTETPTPGAANIYTEPKSLEEKLQEQNDEGDDFFLDGMAIGGTSDTFGKVVDINIELDSESLSLMRDHPLYEVYVPFTGISVSNTGDSDEGESSIATGGGGEVRTKGQSSLIITACLGLQNVPFSVKFDTPFLGMEEVYFRNHFTDESYMREYASHVMLKQFGLPYLRVRPVRLHFNGEYTGFYIMMEAPTQAYVMQRSFGVFDPSQTALFKFKTVAKACPFTDPELQEAENRETPDPYYFERGEHRDDIPEEFMGNTDECVAFLYGQLGKERADVVKGYVENGQDCGVAMVELGIVDRDFGPKSIEASMTNFLDSLVYDTSVADLTDSVDADQFLKNFAAYAVMLNIDSPINNLNNWYVATTAGGNNDWRIVQYDHNNIADPGTAASTLCAAQCGPRMIYWPILRPTCGDTSSHPMVGRIMSNEANTQKYLDYVKEFVDSFDSSAILEVMRAYGDSIKDFIVEDPQNQMTLEEYEDSQLGTDLDGYNTEDPAFLKVLELRLIEVRAQLDALEKGTLPRDGVYGENEVCPDWRASDGEDYILGDVLEEDSCPSVNACEIAAPCYGAACTAEGEFLDNGCAAASPICDSCFPYSRCGSSDDESFKFVESEVCGTEFAECSTASPCFDHKSGMCAYDGEILVTACQEADFFCKSCFPYSRCGTALPTDSPSSSREEETSGATSASRFVLIIPVMVTTVMTGIFSIFM